MRRYSTGRESRGFGPEDAGKRVVTADGTVVGRVDRIRDGRAYVRPESGVLAGFGPRLDDSWAGREALPLDEQQVDAVEDDAIVLR